MNEPDTRASATMEPKLTTLCTYPSSIQAETVKWALEQEGITTFVADSNTITADWLLGPAVGWVKVQVAEADAVAALAVLEKHPNLLKTYFEPKLEVASVCLSCEAAMEEADETCAACGWSFLTGAELEVVEE